MFPKLDLRPAGTDQVELSPESRGLTTFITHDGLYQFKRICFGLASAPVAFQNMMSRILKGVVVYMDDIVVFGNSAAEHHANLVEVLKRISDAGLNLNRKCCFGVKNISFLGHVQGISPLQQKIEALTAVPVLQDANSLRSFLGLATYYAKFVGMFRILLNRCEIFCG